MGYFSNLDQCDRRDRSYYGYEEQREARLHELYDRLEELVATGAPCRSEESFGDADYRYALPCEFSAISDVERAISIVTESDMAEIHRRAAGNGHGQPYAEGYDPYGTACGEVHPNQMSIFEVVVITPARHCAA